MTTIATQPASLTTRPEPPVPVQIKLAAAWTSFMFMYVYVDLLGSPRRARRTSTNVWSRCGRSRSAADAPRGRYPRPHLRAMLASMCACPRTTNHG